MQSQHTVSIVRHHATREVWYDFNVDKSDATDSCIMVLARGASETDQSGAGATMEVFKLDH